MNIDRLIVLNEGYRALISKIVIYPLTTQDQEELQEYRKLGKIETLEEELEGYHEISKTPQELYEKLDKIEALEKELEEYREIGTPEEINKKIGDLEERVDSQKEELTKLRTLRDKLLQSTH